MDGFALEGLAGCTSGDGLAIILGFSHEDRLSKECYYCTGWCCCDRRGGWTILKSVVSWCTGELCSAQKRVQMSGGLSWPWFEVEIAPRDQVPLVAPRLAARQPPDAPLLLTFYVGQASEAPLHVSNTGKAARVFPGASKTESRRCLRQ